MISDALLGLVADLIPENTNHLLVAHGDEPRVYLQLGQNVWMRAAGSAITPQAWHETDQRYQAIFLPLPKGKATLDLCLSCVSPLLAQGGSLYLFGANDAGIKSADSALEKHFANISVAAVGGKGRIFAAQQPLQTDVVSLEKFAAHSSLPIAGQNIDFASYPGLFAKGQLDKATELLIAHLPKIAPFAHVLDYACGLGVLGRAVQLQQPTAKLLLADYDPLAVHAAQQNVPDAATTCIANPENVRNAFDLVISNPPIHTGQALDYDIVIRLIACLHNMLTPDGAAYLVTQVTVPVARFAHESKLAATEVAASSGFRVTRISR